MKPHKVSSRAKLAPVLYGDPVCVILSARMRERTLTYVTEIRDTQKGRKVRPSLRLVVELRGFEPLTPCLPDKYSSQLS